MAQKRLTYFDMAKGIGIFLVVLGHFQGDWFFSLSPYVMPLCLWIFSFHIPLFFMISGMLIRYRNEAGNDLKDTVRKRFRSIMIPYCSFSVIYLLIVVYALLSGSIQPETLYVQLWYTLSLHGMNVLWFLPALFAGELLFILLIKRFGDRLTEVFVPVMAVAATLLNIFLAKYTYATPLLQRVRDMELTLLRPLFVCVFVAIGYYLYGIFKEREGIYVPELLLGIALLAVNIFVHPYNGSVDFRSLVFGNPFLYLISAVAGSAGLILICKNIPPFKPVVFWGVNSLIVMAVHNNESVLYLGMQLAMFINRYLSRARGYICYAVVTLVVVIYTTAMILLINRFFGFLIGKKGFRKSKNET